MSELFQIEASPVVSETTEKKGKKSSLKLGPARTLWEAKAIAEGAEKYYFFSDFVASLNEVEAGVAPTDTRLRPDQRERESQNANLTEKGCCDPISFKTPFTNLFWVSYYDAPNSGHKVA